MRTIGRVAIFFCKNFSKFYAPWTSRPRMRMQSRNIIVREIYFVILLWAAGHCGGKTKRFGFSVAVGVERRTAFAEYRRETRRGQRDFTTQDEQGRAGSGY